MCEGLPRAAGPRPSGDPRRERGWRSEPRGSRPPAPDPASAQPGLDAGAVRAERRRDADRRWPAPRARPGTRGPGHRAGRVRARRSGSSPRPPAGQRAVGLQGGDLGFQQLTLKQHLAQFGFEPLGLQRLAIGGPRPGGGRRGGRPPPPATKVSRHPVRVAAVTPSARESVSRSSPRNRRNTASRLRLRDMRPPRPNPTPPEAVVSVLIITLLRIMSAYRVSQRTVERTTRIMLPS